MKTLLLACCLFMLPVSGLAQDADSGSMFKDKTIVTQGILSLEGDEANPAPGRSALGNTRINLTVREHFSGIPLQADQNAKSSAIEDEFKKYRGQDAAQKGFLSYRPKAEEPAEKLEQSPKAGKGRIPDPPLLGSEEPNRILFTAAPFDMESLRLKLGLQPE